MRLRVFTIRYRELFFDLPVHDHIDRPVRDHEERIPRICRMLVDIDGKRVINLFAVGEFDEVPQVLRKFKI